MEESILEKASARFATELIDHVYAVLEICQNQQVDKVDRYICMTHLASPPLLLIGFINIWGGRLWQAITPNRFQMNLQPKSHMHIVLMIA